MDHSSHDTVITLWFVTATHPEKVIATMPRADRGFGRKLLSQLNPRWPITPIGLRVQNFILPVFRDYPLSKRSWMISP